MLLSAKSTSSYKPKDSHHQRLKVAFSKAIGGLQTAVGITKSAVSGVGLGPPGLQAGLGGLLLVLTAIQVSCYGLSFLCSEWQKNRIHFKTRMISNNWRGEFKRCLRPYKSCRLEMSYRHLSLPAWNNYPSRSFNQHVSCPNLLYRAWNGHIEQLNQLAKPHFLRRVFQNSEDTRAISDHLQAITWSIQNLTVSYIFFWQWYRLSIESCHFKSGGKSA